MSNSLRLLFIFVIFLSLNPAHVSARSLKPSKPSIAKVTCNDVISSNENHLDNMEKLAIKAKLPDNYFSRYHEDAVNALCSDNKKDVDGLVDAGNIEPTEIEAIAKVLGKSYNAPVRSDEGKSYGYSRDKFSDMGLCSSCADNVAQYYTKKPTSECGKLAKQALEGDPESVTKLRQFPSYCTWNY